MLTEYCCRPFLAHLTDIVGLTFWGPRFISLSCFLRCRSLPGLLRHVAKKCICCSQRHEFYLCICTSTSNMAIWIVWILDRQRRHHIIWLSVVCRTVTLRLSKTCCSFTVAVEQYRRESSAVLTRRTFCYRISAIVLIRAEETSRVLVWRRQQSLVWCCLVDVVSLTSSDADSLDRVRKAVAVLSSSRWRSRRRRLAAESAAADGRYLPCCCVGCCFSICCFSCRSYPFWFQLAL